MGSWADAVLSSSTTMEQTNVFKHFKEVANRYDELYGFVYEELSQLTVKHLQLKPKDLLADIGAGTGAISQLIWKKAGLFFNTVVLYCFYSTAMRSFLAIM